MEYNTEFIRRLEDLSERCERTGSVTSTAFLTPAERIQAQQWAAGRHQDTVLIFHGGHPDCERTVAFFLPYYMDADSFTPEETIKAIRLTAHFGEPGHRDYMGSLLGMGIDRDRLGDIWVDGANATVFCLTSVFKHLLSIEKAGRVTVRPTPLALADAVPPPRQVKQVSFSVMSPRLDAVVAGMFHLSRTEAVRHITQGNVSLNYFPCEKTDIQINPGDIISLRGAGKGTVTEFGGMSRKGRTFLAAEILK